VDPEALRRRMNEVFDHAIVYHGFTDYMRDYEVVLQATAHTVRLVFSDLDVLPAPLGYRPFEVKD
jgi:hypothetical protein